MKIANVERGVFAASGDHDQRLHSVQQLRVIERKQADVGQRSYGCQVRGRFPQALCQKFDRFVDVPGPAPVLDAKCHVCINEKPHSFRMVTP